MDPKQQDAALDEVDRKIERLRASYDQYFMGLDRIAPFDARRDVDRRIRTLREEHLRNTATKFRFQTLVARFVTYTTYWDRITRQIEEGTFKRDVDRAKQRVAGAAAQARVSELELDVDIDLEMGTDTDDLDAAIDRAIRDAEQEEERLSLISIVPDEPPPRVAPPPVPRAAAIRAAVFTDEDFDAIDSAFDGLQMRESRVPGAPRPLGARTSAVPDAAPTPPVAAQSSELKDTTTRKPSARFARPKELEAPVLADTRTPERGGGAAAAPTRDGGAPSATHRTVPAAASPPASPVSQALSLLDDEPAEGPKTDKVALPQAASPRAASAASAASPAPAAPRVTAGRTHAQPPAATAKPVAQAKPAPATSAPAAAKVDEETRKLYARYVEMRRACNESTANVRLESLAKNMDEIRKKHGGREIGFEVVVKDGRAAIKPVPR